MKLVEELSLPIRTYNIAALAGLFLFTLLLLAGCSEGDDTNTPDTDSTPTSEENSEESTPVITHSAATLDVEFLCDVDTPIGLTSDMLNAIELAEDQYRDLLVRTALSSRKFVDYTTSEGEWVLVNSSRWTSGFLPGVFWYLYGLTDTEFWQTEALFLTLSLEERTTATDNDTGFQIYSTYGVGRDIMNTDWIAADIAISTAAATLFSQRFNPNVGAYRAWPQNENNPFEITSNRPFEVNVDMLMNMEVLLAAVEVSGDSEQYNSVISHADITWDHLIRQDFSSYHVAAFHADGSVNFTRTEQGWLEESTWSRGQSWAVYGYVMLYRYTQLPRMLERSEKAYQFFKRATAARGVSLVPYADFDAPIDIRNPLDTSAAAIVASAAIELYEATGNTLYLSDANDILNELIEHYLSESTLGENSHFESLLVSGSEQYFREDDVSVASLSGYEVGASFGDFYFLEALYRLRNTHAPNCN